MCFSEKKLYLFSIAVLLIILTTLIFQLNRNDSPVSIVTESFISQETDKPFQDVVDDAEFAISERNFRITNQLKIGNAIKERGNKAFPENNVILFCNIQYAEKMLALDPDYVNYCPGQIAVREEAERVIVSAPLVPRSPDNSALNSLVDEVNVLIRESVDFSVRQWQEVDE